MVEALIILCIQGNRKAQRELYEKYALKFFRIGYRYLQDTLEAEDAVINSFIKIFNNLSRLDYRNEVSTEAWMKKIMVNECLMLLRKKNQFYFCSEESPEYKEISILPVTELEAEDIYTFILLLPTGYRTVFNLYVIEGFSHKEIGKQLGISEDTSKSQLFKAKKTLQELLLKEGIKYGR